MEILAIYLAIGVLVNYIGPLSKKIDEEIVSTKEPSFVDLLKEKPPASFWKIFLFEFILRLFTILLYPILFVIISIDYYRSRNQKQVNLNRNLDENLLYYWNMGGAGNIKCFSCNYSQNIISFLHGIGAKSLCNSGFQCQKCGKFHVIEYYMDNLKVEMCECGGNLSRDEPLFCPICKKTDLRYSMNYIT